jgi:GT2 family glycosyltransferase
MEAKKIYIIIVNWNGKNDTLECLDSINKMGYKNYEIVIVDNGSKDDSVEAIKNKHPEAVILEAGQNLGFGNNVGCVTLEHGPILSCCSCDTLWTLRCWTTSECI